MRFDAAECSNIAVRGACKQWHARVCACNDSHAMALMCVTCLNALLHMHPRLLALACMHAGFCVIHSMVKANRVRAAHLTLQPPQVIWQFMLGLQTSIFMSRQVQVTGSRSDISCLHSKHSWVAHAQSHQANRTSLFTGTEASMY